MSLTPVTVTHTVEVTRTLMVDNIERRPGESDAAWDVRVGDHLHNRLVLLGDFASEFEPNIGEANFSFDLAPKPKPQALVPKPFKSQIDVSLTRDLTIAIDASIWLEPLLGEDEDELEARVLNTVEELLDQDAFDELFVEGLEADQTDVHGTDVNIAGFCGYGFSSENKRDLLGHDNDTDDDTEDDDINLAS